MKCHVLSNLILTAGLVCALNAPALGETDTEMIVGGEPAAEGNFPGRFASMTQWTTRSASAAAPSSRRNGC
jgi:hypothetical protein